MKFVIQRVTGASVTVDNEIIGKIGKGFLVLIGISQTDTKEIADKLAPILWSRGLLIVGLDVIGNSLTEINVTSPTCFVEISQQTGLNVAALMMDALTLH